LQTGILVILVDSTAALVQSSGDVHLTSLQATIGLFLVTPVNAIWALCLLILVSSVAWLVPAR
jgi:hypothetical protein